MKKNEDMLGCVDFQLKTAKKEYMKKYGTKECLKRDDAFLQGVINTLAWVKVFAVKDESYLPHKRESVKVTKK